MSEIGDKIREIRTAKGLTIQSIAEKTDLSSSFISRMERGDINPSLSSVKKIADALDISIGYLFDDRNSGEETPEPAEDKVSTGEVQVVRKDLRRKLVYPGQNIYDYLLTPSIRNVGIEFILTVLEPGGSSGLDFYSHEGEECVLVNKGTLRLYVGDEVFVLNEGDSMHFRSTIPHRYENKTSAVTEVVWVTVPPTF